MSAGTLSLNEAILDIEGSPLDKRYARILKALNHLMTVRSYYSPDHEQYAVASRKACAAIVESMGDHPAITIEIGTEGMMLGGQTVEAGHREVRQLHDLLVPLNIARLEIDRGLTADDLRNALETLHDYKLKLGASDRFQEISIDGLPATVRTIGCKLFSGDELSSVLGEKDHSIEDLAHQFLDLVGEIIANMSLARPTGGEDPHAPGSHHGKSGLDGLSDGHLPADLQQLAEALRELARRESDPHNFLALIQNAQKALEISRNPNSVDLVFRLLRKELGKEAPQKTAPPVSRLQDPDQQREKIDLMRTHLAETIAAATRAGDLDPASTQDDFLGICFRILATEPSPSLESHLIAALEMALGSAEVGTEDVQLCARWLVFGWRKKQAVTDRKPLQAVLRLLRTHHLELLPAFWMALWDQLEENLRNSLWPFLVNDILLGTGQSPDEVNRGLLKAVGSVGIQAARSSRNVLFGLPAFRRNQASGVIFSLPCSRLPVLHALLLESPLASWHAPRLQKHLLRTSPNSLPGIVMHLLGDLEGENSALLAALLEEEEQDALSDQLRETVARLLADGLMRLPRRDRNQAWVAKGLEWLHRLDAETASPVLKHVQRSKWLLFFPAWPQKCRQVAERMVR